jgi:mercuric ion transport protein
MKNKAQKATLIGSLVTSIIASACCVGPIVFALLGVSSAGLLSKIGPYKPIISVIALIMLGFSFYLTYREKETVDCELNTFCANPKSNIWNKRVLWISTILILGFLTIPYWSIYLA